MIISLQMTPILMNTIIFFSGTGLNMNAFSFRNGGCTHLCLPVPQGRRCACADSYFLQIDGFTCTRTPGTHA